VAVPPPFVTVKLPPVNPAGVTAVIVVEETTTYEAAFTPLNLTEDIPAKLVPVIVTVCPPPSHIVVGV
jgi:hypothetical protein